MLKRAFEVRTIIIGWKLARPTAVQGIKIKTSFIPIVAISQCFANKIRC